MGRSRSENATAPRLTPRVAHAVGENEMMQCEGEPALRPMCPRSTPNRAVRGSRCGQRAMRRWMLPSRCDASRMERHAVRETQSSHVGNSLQAHNCHRGDWRDLGFPEPHEPPQSTRNEGVGSLRADMAGVNLACAQTPRSSTRMPVSTSGSVGGVLKRGDCATREPARIPTILMAMPGSPIRRLSRRAKLPTPDGAPTP